MPGSETRQQNLICLVKIDNRIYESIPPIGLLYLGDALKKAGYRVEIHHILEDEIESCAASVAEKNPLFVGLSVVTGWGIAPAARFSKMFKDLSAAPVVWGNVHPSHLPEQCLSEDYVDIVCIGEAEETVVELAACLKDEQPFDRVKGIGYTNEDGEIIVTPRRPRAKDLDAFDVDWSLVDIERYIAPCWGIERTLRVIASRGCPFDCSFCYNQAFNQRLWSRHSASYVIEKLSRLAREHNIKALYFNDDNFFVNQRWAWEILNALSLPYFVNVRAELVDDDFAGRLAETGCRELLIGLESGSETVLQDVLKKGVTVEENYRAVKALSRYPQIKLVGSFIMAVPGETAADRDATMQMISKCLQMHSNFRVILASYRPMPGTELYELALQKGFVPPADTEGWSAYDALANDVDLPWVDRDTRDNIQSMCMAMDTLEALNKFSIPILKPIVRKSILNGQYDSCLMRGLNRVRTGYAFGSNGQPGTAWLRRMVDHVKAQKNLD